MPRSSRHKSKRSVKEGREYSDTEEDVSVKGKRREGKESGEKRKSGHGQGNGYSSDEYVSSKRKKERGEKVGSDRWNGSGEVLGAESETREGSLKFDDKVLKSKGLIDLKSKISSSRHDGEMKEENVDLFVGKEESVSVKGDSKKRDVSEKDKLDRDLARKDDYKLKDTREKEKGSERDIKSSDSNRDLDYRDVDREEQKVKKGFESKGWSLEAEYGKYELEKEGDRRRKKRIAESDEKDKYQDRDRDSSDVNLMSRHDRDKDGSARDERHKDIALRDKHYWPSEEMYGKHESEKERETRRRKRISETDDKNKYQEGDKDSGDINLTSRRERNKDRRDRDDRQKEISSRDKNPEYYDRDTKIRDADRREGSDRERTHKYDEYSDDRASRDHVGRKNDYKYKDYKETRGSLDKQEYGDVKSRSAKEYIDSASKSAGAKEETVFERETSLSFHPDDPSASQSRRKRSPSSTGLATRDQYRHSKQSDVKYKESLPEERSRSNLIFGKEGNGSGSYDRVQSSRVVDKSVTKVEGGNVADFSSERHRNTDRRASPVRLADKSQSPSSIDRRHLSRSGDRRSFDYEDSGHRSSGYNDPNYHYHDRKRSQDRKLEAPSMDASSQADGDNIHASSSFSRSARTPACSRSFLPPVSPLKHGGDNSYSGSAEEDGRGKLNNHSKRYGDSNMGRMQGNAWWGAPNWTSPMGNGYLPFPHGPGAVGFHPMMQQFPPQMFGVRPPMDHSGVPFHMPDGDRFSSYGRPFAWPNPVDETCPSSMPNWDSNNVVPGEGFSQGRGDWDQNRSLAGSASREPSVDKYKSASMESPSGNRRATAEHFDELSSQSNHGLKNEPFHQVDKAGNEDNFGSEIPSSMSAPLKEISGRVTNAKVSEEGKKYVDIDDHVRCSCVYLSKIDISPHLASSDLFDQCVSLLGLKQSTRSDSRMSNFILEAEHGEEGESPKRNTYISRGPVFAEVSDSLLENAMSLYRKYRDDTAVNYSSFASIGNHLLLSPETQGSEPSTLGPSMSAEANHQELVFPQPPSESQASSINEASNTIAIKLEAPSSMPCDDNVDADVSNQPEVLIKAVSSPGEEKGDLIAVLGTQVAEDTTGDVVDKGTADMDEGTRVESPKAARCEEDDADGTKETNDEPAGVETRTGEPTSNVHLEGCEDKELNECGSVNLSRIH